MINDIKLTSAMRHSLLSHQQVKSLTSTVEKRLATGKKISEILDGPATYFKAKGLYDGAADLLKRKQGIDQGISTIKVAQNGIEAGRTLIEQIKGLAEEARTGSDAKRYVLQQQAEKLLQEYNDLIFDTRKEGVNLLNNDPLNFRDTYQDDIDFANSGSHVFIDSFDSETGITRFSANNLAGTNPTHRQSNVGLDATSGNQQFRISYEVRASEAGAFNVSMDAGDAILIVPGSHPNKGVGNNIVPGTNWVSVSGTTFNYNLNGDFFDVDVSRITPPYTANDWVEVRNVTVELIDNGSTTNPSIDDSAEHELVVDLSDDTQYTINGVDLTSRGLGLLDMNFSTTGLETTIAELESALDYMDATAATFATDFALLQTRLGFTEDFVNVREEAGDKLTLADLEEESANLLALQTRNQLTLNSMSSSARSLQGILSLLQGV